jgi:hypothetical protein
MTAVEFLLSKTSNIMKTFFLILSILFVVSMFLTYLVEDYRKGIIYKGFLGKIQNIFKH